ncbi:MAG: L,D-transpeptidase [Ectothiorhodospiraceae bacterium]|nr:L,D-transpeptidase [Chromatiales bacterium]MCP5153570.1 L,D-transpeptidase [Ectothiorhodospiraceae bacterium]
MSSPIPERDGARRGDRQHLLLVVTVLVVSALQVAWPARGSAAPTIAAGGPALPAISTGPDDEALLVEALEQVRRGDLDRALRDIETLVARNPKFRLAQLVYGDLLLAKTRPIGGFGAQLADRPGALADLRDEARVRWRNRLRSLDPDWLPAPLLRMSASQRRALVIDVSESRLYVFLNTASGPRLERSVYVSTGKNGAHKVREGDQRTPLGVYFLTGRIAPASLPDFYGAGAFPVNYPNEWDVRQGRTGYGIWLHGVPADTYSRPPRASDGCMALPNEDMSALWTSLDADNTPVIIAERITWLPRAEVEARALALEAAIDGWRRSWESRADGEYARFYASDFTGAGLGRQQWLEHKRRVNAGKRFIRVALDDLSAFEYPGEDGLVVVTFEQSYRSDNFSERARKRMYWRAGPRGEATILHEDAATLRPEHLRGIPYSARSEMSALSR